MGVVIGNTEFAYFQMPASGPVEGQTYPKQSEKLVDYFLSKHMTMMRFMFSWEGMQQAAFGPIPGAGNYKTYFDNLKRMVDYATSKGMTVQIQPWQANSSGGAGGWLYKGVQPSQAQFNDFWVKMVNQYKSNPLVTYGLVNEPNHMSTMVWWAAAQSAINAIRSTGSTQRIFVPGVSYSQASTWTSPAWDDTDSPKHSNAYGILNANGVGKPLADPLNNTVVEVHTYLDQGQGGGASDITSVTAARDHLKVVVTEAKAHGYKIYLGELGIVMTQPLAKAAWADFISYLNETPEIIAYTWFAAGAPGWWPDVNAPHFSITPTNPATYTGDTINMQMIQGAF